MRTVISILIILLLAGTLKAQKVYKLISKADSADFNYKALYSIDTFSNRREAFVSVKGLFTVYTFIATFQGVSHRDDKQHDFHDILIIKTRKDRLITDAFQYTLEWSEMPLSYDLFQSKDTHVVLSDGLSIKKLNLKRAPGYDDLNVKTEEEGVIKIK